MGFGKAAGACLLLASLAVLSAGLSQLCKYKREEARTGALYAELSELHGGAFVEEGSTRPFVYSQREGQDAFNDGRARSGEVDSKTVSPSKGERIEPATVHSGLRRLHEQNNDCVAWISIEGTVINYPVMYRPGQKDYYLHRDFYGNDLYAGSLYIAEICHKESDNLIIYGHNMNNGTMFGELDRYEKEAFYQAHRYICLETLNETRFYEIICVSKTPVYTANDFQYYGFADADSAEDFNEYLAQCQKRSLYDTGLTAEYGDHLLTLSTCEYSQKNGRLLVVAKQVEETRG